MLRSLEIFSLFRFLHVFLKKNINKRKIITKIKKQTVSSDKSQINEISSADVLILQ